MEAPGEVRATAPTASQARRCLLWGCGQRPGQLRPALRRRCTRYDDGDTTGPAAQRLTARVLQVMMTVLPGGSVFRRQPVSVFRRNQHMTQQTTRFAFDPERLAQDAAAWTRLGSRAGPWCGAQTRAGHPCRNIPVGAQHQPRNGRCRMHGGLSTGPKTELARQPLPRVTDDEPGTRTDDVRALAWGLA